MLTKGQGSAYTSAQASPQLSPTQQHRRIATFGEGDNRPTATLSMPSPYPSASAAPSSRSVRSSGYAVGYAEASRAQSPEEMKQDGDDGGDNGGELVEMVKSQQSEMVHQVAALHHYHKEKEKYREQYGWECEICTLKNDPHLTKCDACGAPRPAPAAKKTQQQTQTERPWSESLRQSQHTKQASHTAATQGTASDAEAPGSFLRAATMAPATRAVPAAAPLPRAAPTGEEAAAAKQLPRAASVMPAQYEHQPTPHQQTWQVPAHRRPTSDHPLPSSTPSPIVSAPPIAPARVTQWTCPKCTLINQINDDRCAVCDEPRPASIKVAVAAPAQQAPPLPSAAPSLSRRATQPIPLTSASSAPPTTKQGLSGRPPTGPSGGISPVLPASKLAVLDAIPSGSERGPVPVPGGVDSPRFPAQYQLEQQQAQYAEEVGRQQAALQKQYATQQMLANQQIVAATAPELIKALPPLSSSPTLQQRQILNQQEQWMAEQAQQQQILKQQQRQQQWQQTVEGNLDALINDFFECSPHDQPVELAKQQQQQQQQQAAVQQDEQNAGKYPVAKAATFNKMFDQAAQGFAQDLIQKKNGEHATDAPTQQQQQQRQKAIHKQREQQPQQRPPVEQLPQEPLSSAVSSSSASSSVRTEFGAPIVDAAVKHRRDRSPEKQAARTSLPLEQLKLPSTPATAGAATTPVITVTPAPATKPPKQTKQQAQQQQHEVPVEQPSNEGKRQAGGRAAAATSLSFPPPSPHQPLMLSAKQREHQHHREGEGEGPRHEQEGESQEKANSVANQAKLISSVSLTASLSPLPTTSPSPSPSPPPSLSPLPSIVSTEDEEEKRAGISALAAALAASANQKATEPAKQPPPPESRRATSTLAMPSSSSSSSLPSSVSSPSLSVFPTPSLSPVPSVPTSKPEKKSVQSRPPPLSEAKRSESETSLTVESREDSSLAPPTPVSTNRASSSGRRSPSDAAYRADMREKVRSEILSTEKFYVDCLQDLTKHYMIPIQKQGPKIGVEPKHVSAIFGNLTMLTQFHTIFMEDLKKNKNTAEVFVQFADFLKMYTQYIAGYEKSIATINSLRANKQFQKLLEDKRDELKGRGIMTYLIMPVQRIPRYVLLLRELKKYTPPDHPEMEALQVALTKIESIAEHVNENKRHVENMSKLLDIQNRLKKTDLVILKPDRRLLKEGMIRRLKEDYVMERSTMEPYSHDIEKELFFLFNDLLVWTTEEFDLVGHVPLDSLLCLPDQSHFLVPYTLSLGVRGKPYCPDMVFACKDQQEKDEWQRYILSAINTATDPTKKRKKATATQALHAQTLPQQKGVDPYGFEHGTLNTHKPQPPPPPPPPPTQQTVNSAFPPPSLPPGPATDRQGTRTPNAEPDAAPTATTAAVAGVSLFPPASSSSLSSVSVPAARTMSSAELLEQCLQLNISQATQTPTQTQQNNKTEVPPPLLSQSSHALLSQAKAAAPAAVNSQNPGDSSVYDLEL